MINLETVKTLRALRLPGMARELESQLEDPQRYKDLSFEDRLALMVDAEGLSRRQNTITRRIREARLSESTASVESIEYHEDRELDKGLITKLATCSYIQENHHVILKGATGAGKSYIANALGVAACRKLYKVRYIRLPDLLNEFTVAKAMNTQNKVKTAYDCFSTALGIVMSFAFFGFGVFEGVKLGTVVCAFVNGFLIGRFTVLLERKFEFRNRFDMEKYFSM